MRARLSGVLDFARDAVRRNLGLKVLALVISILLWWFVAGESDVQVGFSVPIELRNVPPGMAVTNKVERLVDVRLAGPSTLVGGLTQKEVSAVVDLSGARSGRAVYPLSEQSIKAPVGCRVLRIYPDSVEVALDRLETRSLPVTARIAGDARLRSRITKITVDPPTLQVEALPDDFVRLKSLVTEEVSPGSPEGVFSTRVRVDLPEGHAKIVGNSNVRVTVQFRP